MTVLCPGCRRRIRIPPEKAGTPNLRARCGSCGVVFAVAEAQVAPAAPAPSTAPSPAPTPAPAVAPPPVPAAAPPPARAVAPRAPAPPRVSSSPASTAPAVPAAGAAAAPSAPQPAAGDATAAARRSAGPNPRGWRRCANHPTVNSEGVCTQCGRGLCGECVKRQGTAAICPECDALCVPAAEQERKEALARRRARPLSEELGAVFAYPFSDKVAFVLLAVFVGVFALAASLAAFGSGVGIVVSQGLLYAYAFSAINRVSSGNFSGFMPNLSDWTDLVQPVRAGLAALLISTGPLIALGFLYSWHEVAASVGAGRLAAVVPRESPSPSPTLPPNVAALLENDSEAGGAAAAERGDGETGQPGGAGADFVEPPLVPGWAIFAFALALLWKLVYSPIALVAAAISRSFVATLNPLAGLDAIRRMGSTYWSAMVVYTGIVVVAGIVTTVLSLIPLAGRLLAAFVDSYAYLAVGCLLGFAVFKKAPELNLD